MRTLPPILLLLAALSSPLNGAAEPVLFEDDFKGGLKDGWSWIRENRSAWRTTNQGLEIRVEPGNMWGGANNARNILVRPAPDPADHAVEAAVKIWNKPTEQYEQVNLVWFYDDSNMIKVGQEMVDGQLSIVMGREQEDRTRTIAIIPLDTHEVEVRLLVEGDQLRGQYRPAGTDDWRDAGKCDLPGRGRARISLQCYQGPGGAEHWARLTGFRLRSTARRTQP